MTSRFRPLLAVLLVLVAGAIAPAHAATPPRSGTIESWLREGEAFAARGRLRAADSLAWRVVGERAAWPEPGTRERIDLLERVTRLAWPPDAARLDSVIRWSREVAEAREAAPAGAAREEAWFTAGLANVRHQRADSARACFARAASALRARPGHRSADEASLFARIADAWLLLARTKDMSAAVEPALAAWHAAAAPDSLVLARVLVPKARAEAEGGDGVHAREDLELAAGVYSRRLDPDDARRIPLWQNLASVRSIYGDPRGGVAALEEALRIARASLPAGDGKIVDLESQGSSLASGAGDYLLAVRFGRAAVADARAGTGARSLGSATALLGLANSLRHLGDLASAFECAHEAVAIQESLLAAQDTRRAYGLSVLASIESDHGDHALAYRHFGDCARIRSAVLGPANLMTLYALGAQAEEALDLRRFAEARRILAGVEPLQSREGPSERLITTVMALGAAQYQLGHSDSALVAFDRAVAMTDSLFGAGSEASVVPRLRRIPVWAALGRHDAALKEACALARIAREQTWRTIAGLSDREAMAAEETRGVSLSMAISLALAPGTPAASRAEVWELLARSRAMVFRVQAERRARRDVPADVAQLSARVDSARASLAHALLAGPARASAPGAPSRDSLRREVEDAERALAQRLPAAAPTVERPVLAPALAGLHERERLLAYVRYESLDSTVRVEAGEAGHARYAAFVGEPSGRVRLVGLGDAAPIDERVARWNALAARGANDAAGAAVLARRLHDAGAAVRRALWDPLAPLLSGASRVELVPDGAVANVDFAALPSASGAPLALDGPRLASLATEQDLSPRPHDGAGLLAVGAPDFDDAGESAPLAAAVREPSADSLRLRFSALPRSGDEARECGARWDGAHAGVAHVLAGPAATEAAVRREAPERAVLHFATHGFVIDEHARDGAALASRGVGAMVAGGAAREATPGRVDFSVAGLALSGANAPGRLAADDGVLTGAEIAALDLSRVRCAVLSACRTGATESDRFESLQGLERAFRLAGVGQVVMSLWPVDDADAREWMRAFYRAWLVPGTDAADAVHAADRERYRALRSGGAEPSPARWAPFFVRGEGR